MIGKINKEYWKELFVWLKKRWQPFKWYFFLLLIVGILNGMAWAISPYVLKKIIDQIKNTTNMSFLLAERWKFVLYLLLINGIQLILNLYPAMRAVMNYRHEMAIREEVFSKLLLKSEDFFHKFRIGDILTRLTDDLSGFTRVSWFLCSGIFRFFNALCVILFSFVVMFYLNWKLALMAFSLLPIASLIFLYAHPLMKEAFENEKKIISFTTNYLENNLKTIDILKVYNAVERESDRFRNKIIADRNKKELKVAKLQAFFGSFFPNLSFMGQVLVVAMGGYYTIKGEMTIGSFFAFFTYLTFLLFYVIDMTMFFISGRQALVSVDRLRELEESKDENSFFIQSLDAIKIGKLEKLELKNIYLKGRMSSVNLTLKKGEWIGISGKVGSGKSTLLKIIAGILEPTSGIYLLNGNPIAQIDRRYFFKRVGYCESEPLIFSVSIEENILFFREKDEDLLKKVVKVSRLEEDIQKMKDGIKTVVGERGIMVSGGQRQRIAIARALYNHNLELLLLDDVTAGLDAENEIKFLSCLRENYPNLSVIFVSHRQSSLNFADRIIFLE